jgi:hypothetical protein
VAEQSGASSVPPGRSAEPNETRLASGQGGAPGHVRKRLSTRAWILASVGAGIVLIVLIAVILASSQTTTAPTEDAADRQDETQAIGGIEVPSTPVTSPDGIELTELAAVSRRDPDPRRSGTR